MDPGPRLVLPRVISPTHDESHSCAGLWGLWLKLDAVTSDWYVTIIRILIPSSRMVVFWASPCGSQGLLSRDQCWLQSPTTHI